LENLCDKYSYFVLISNKVNLGYCCSINKGLQYSKSKYKVILNSDTEVNKDWLDYLLLPLYNENIAITGPLSNAASYQSIPEIKDFQGWKINSKVNDFENINEKLFKKFQFDYPLLPIVNGFCMAIKNEIFDKIGYFDEDLFKKGYGEENDFCLRAIDAGFLIALNMHCYIYHAKTKSFLPKEKKKLSKKSNEILKKKYGLFRMKNINQTLNNNYFLEYIRREINEHF
jgi:GT2 family glycosyltransferase